MIKNFDTLIQMLRDEPVKKRVAVVAAQDEHTLEAVIRAYHDGLVEPVLLGDKAKITELLTKLEADDLADSVVEIDDPVMCAERACEMAKSGEIDCIMKGKVETGTLMKVLVNKEKGIRKGDVMSLLAFMESPNYHKVFAITDVGLLTYPNKEQKKAAIANAIEAFHALGVENPKVAILAAVEKVNPKMPETVEADEIKQEGINGAVIEGPISYDLADILVVPDIVSGNIAAKTITVIGGGRTGGTVLGALVPVLLVSRSATADDKYMSIVISALVGRKKR